MVIKALNEPADMPEIVELTPAQREKLQPLAKQITAASEQMRRLSELSNIAAAQRKMLAAFGLLDQSKWKRLRLRAARAAAEEILRGAAARASTKREDREALVAREFIRLHDAFDEMRRTLPAQGARARKKTKDEKLAALAAEVKTFFFDDDGKIKSDARFCTNEAITACLLAEKRTPYSPASTLAHVKRIAKEYRQEII